ncbi:molecular chaperone DnaJ [Sphingomonas sp. Leaf24]|uniref:J domain-containing protein n=1 Tax=unclassified Sphingomonas TaxID=196159 RepID=UPI0006FA333C|nr:MULTISPECIES: DnaJ domain-containing protein [unclassified Sphingomonas]KQM22366.1 molecular chaperone DnaJ [Sphingomonas sp. Leaf5]KQM93908.1 molecular chaperone DnaJ [Sphingomonas sp. Leaf22]KQM93959.1 molecular chaperone DnaJ [Sphingomonas sp. Leaf24]KQN73882.1 molecular chaperone DnaJ [Sphingomonas sp. Leaf62]
MLKLVLIVAVILAFWLWLRAKPKKVGGEAEARAILGVGKDAKVGEIRAAHRRLMQAVHPDRGGSADLARRINAARDVLLGRLRH